MSTSASPNAEKPRVPLNARERRVLGVLIEKQKTTPEYYPMTIAAIVTGANQKSNRDPVSGYDADDIEDTLQDLRGKGAVVLVEGYGRAVKWKHSLYEWWELKGKPAEMAVLAELLLRGPQTEGELRARANRMDPIADLPALQAILEYLTGRGLVMYLSPPGQRRGVVVAHALYPPDEMERIKQANAGAIGSEAATSSVPGRTGELETLRVEVATLQERLETLAAEVRELKASLGA